MRRAVTHRAQAGHTLLELLVALSVGAVLLGLASQVSTNLSTATKELEVHARNVDDLEVLLAQLSQDLGAAERVSRTAKNSVHLSREPARAALLGVPDAGSDPGIIYGWRNGLLRREDLGLGETIVLSRRLTAFEVFDIGGIETRIAMATGSGDALRQLTLVWTDR